MRNQVVPNNQLTCKARMVFSLAGERIAWRYAGVAAVTNMLASRRLSEGMS